MALPRDLRTLFDELPNARAARDDRIARARRDLEEAARKQEEEDERARASLRGELEVAWDWLLTDGHELAAEMRKAQFLRLELLGPLDREGRPVPWQLGARVFLVNDEGGLEVVRQDEYRELRYPVRTVEDFLRVEPPGVTRAFVEAVRAGAIWQRVAEQIRASTAPPIADREG
ncbi:MAG: hypothetical protein U0228_13265 [Myxococcaceae bacterium]